MTTFFRRLSPSSNCIQWSQKTHTYLECSCAKHMMSSMTQSLTHDDFKITFRPGKDTRKANAISWCSYLAPRLVIRPLTIKIINATSCKTSSNYSLWYSTRFKHCWYSSSWSEDNLDHIDLTRASCSQSQHSCTDYKPFKWHDRLLFLKHLLYVPNGSSHLQVIQHYHDTYTVGHFGIKKTLDLVAQSFWWSHLHKFVQDYVLHMWYML